MYNISVTCLKKLETVSVTGRKVSRLDVTSSGDQEYRLSALVLRSREPLLVNEPISLALLRSCSKLLMLDLRSENKTGFKFNETTTLNKLKQFKIRMYLLST